MDNEEKQVEEKCPCQTDTHACCACVSMKCHECIKPKLSKFVQGRFCSNCGRPLRADAVQSYHNTSKEIKENLIRIISSLHEEVHLGVYIYFTDEEAEIIADFLIKNGVNINKEAHLKYVGENIISDIQRSAYKNADGDLFITKAEFEKIQKKYTGDTK